MAKLTFILTLFFLITFSYAKNLEQENDVIDIDLPDKPTILLPSQNQQSEEETTTVGFDEIFPEKTIVEAKETQEHVDRPMKIVRFHPINRHFPASRLGSLRGPLHRCHHGEGRFRRTQNSMEDELIGRPRQISFGNDMMVAAGENGDFDPMVHVEVREVPERWNRIHRHHRLHHHHRHDGMPRFPMSKYHDFFANHRFTKERDGERDEERKEMHGREERQDWGIMRSVRKFLNDRF